MPNAVLPLYAEMMHARSAALRGTHQDAVDRWEQRIPAALAGWHVDFDPAERCFVLYRRDPNLATLPTHSFYAALSDVWRIAAYYELLPVADLERFYALRLAFLPPWHRCDGRLRRG
jgi:hypothetical protein